MSTLYAFGDKIIPYRTDSVHFFGAYELSNYEGPVQGLGSASRLLGGCRAEAEHGQESGLR